MTTLRGTISDILLLGKMWGNKKIHGTTEGNVVNDEDGWGLCDGLSWYINIGTLP